MRKLASLRVIDALNPIPNADAIEVAAVGGWNVVVKKGEFEVGDIGMFFEIDSFLPIEPRYSFLMNSAIKWRGMEGIRLRSIKLRKQLSQGLILPLSMFPEVQDVLASEDVEYVTEAEGLDFTEFLGVQKWERDLPACLSGLAKGSFPAFIPISDEERIQNCQRQVLDSYDEGDVYEATVKMDGSSMTVYYLGKDSQYNHDGEPKFGVCSRRLDLVESEDNQFWKTARERELIETLQEINRITGCSYALRGELCGPSIQSNHERLDEYQFFLYNIWDIDNQRYLGMEERDYLLSLLPPREFKRCPRVYVGTLANLFQREDLVACMLTYAEGKTATGAEREGLVWKKVDGTASFKTVSNKYLLGVGE